MDVRIGPFRLVAPLATGGMGSVFRGEHIARKTPVAFKALTTERALDSEWQSQFRDEVRAVARLQHPGIVSVFDYGVITAEAADASGGELTAGSPFLVMELAEEGTLAERAPESWVRARAWFVQILNALAHAHARGVIHLDLKPQNVLVASGAQLKLSDFGLAQSLDEITREQSATLAGTPRYMAPEQIRSQLRDQGPWTDLYAFGCLAWWALCGSPPFDGTTNEQVMRAQLEAPLPALSPRIPIPVGVVAWLNRLLEKNPQNRYRFAADATFDLERIETLDDATEIIEPVVSKGGAGTHERTLAQPVAILSGTLPPLPTAREMTDPSRSFSLRWSGHEEPLAEPLSMQVIGTGLSLYGLRPIPMVNREHERAAVTDTLARVAQTARPEVLVLRGRSGTGKSRIAQWACERALETGAAFVARIALPPYGGPNDALARLVSDDLRCAGLDRDDIRRRVQRRYGCLKPSPFDLVAIGEMVYRAEQESQAPQNPIFGSRAEWYAVAMRYFVRQAQSRPYIVWIDDAQFDADVLAFVHHALTMDLPVSAPVLFLLTIRDDAVAERALAQQRLEQLQELDGTSVVPIAPLDERAHRGLVEQLLRLEPALATSVAKRTGGNPLFAVQLVGDWVQRGVLQIGEEGFALAADERGDLPDDLFNVWSSRLDRFVSGRDSQWQQALELAAALGQNVMYDEWSTAARFCDVVIPSGLSERLLDEGLAVPWHRGWTFCHGMLRESVELRCDRSHWQTYHRACAQMLETRYPGNRRYAERIANHYVRAGHLQAALKPMLDAAERYTRRSDHDNVERIFAEHTALLDELQLPAHSVERGWQLVQHARNASIRMPAEELEAKLEQAREIVEANPDAVTLHASYNYVRARVARLRGYANEALPFAEAAVAAYRQIDNPEGVAISEKGLAEQYRRLGRLDDAVASYRSALHHFGETQDVFQLGWCRFGLAVTLKQKGRFEEAEELVEAAIQDFERSGGVIGLMPAYNELAEIARWRGDLDTAQASYERAHEMMPPVHVDRGIVSVNLALVATARNQFARARALAERGEKDLRTMGRLGSLVYVWCVYVLCDAADRRWEAWDRHFAELETALEKGVLDGDIPQTLERAGDLAAAAGDAARARAAYDVSLAQYRGLGEKSAAERVQSALDALG